MIFCIHQLLYISVFLFTSYAIQCVSKTEKGKEKSCTGDVCVNLLYSYKNTTIKDCLTGFNYTGCTTIDNATTFCFCHTDNCNSHTIIDDQHNPAADYNCSYYNKYSQEEFLEDTKTITVSLLCYIEGTQWWGDSIRYTSVYAGGLNSWKAYILQMDEKEPELDLRSYYYIGGVYAFSGQNDDLHYFYKCHGDFCNEHFDFSWLPRSKDVNCVKSVFFPDETPTCQGEFCVFAVRSDDPTYNISYCMRTNQTNSDGKFEIGMYKFKNAVNYICKTDNCNINKSTAMKSIKEFPNGNLNTLTTSTPLLSTGIPLDSPQHSPVKNIAEGYCRIHVLYTLFITFLYSLLPK